jgi:exonuclease SbcD
MKMLKKRILEMKLIHTADWHLGRIFWGVHLTDDQAYVLNQLVAVVRDTKPDAILVSGDIYDRSVPPTEAVRRLDDVLSEIVLGLKIPMIIIAGNHDGPERLGFASRLLQEQRLHIFGSLESSINPVVIEDTHGPVCIYPVPYAEAATVREKLKDDTPHDPASAMKAIIDRIKDSHPEEKRSILMAHAFVVGGKESESERPLSIGGTSTVEASLFDSFDYVALGHLHRPQEAGKDTIIYPGSLMKYSFSESSHTKSVTLVEMDAEGKCAVERIPLNPRRDLRIVRGYLKDILKGSKEDENPDDYILVELLDTGAILDVMGQLREVYPNVLHLERPNFEITGKVRAIDHHKVDDAELFASFFSQVTGEELTKAQRTAFASVVDEIHRNERRG